MKVGREAWARRLCPKHCDLRALCMELSWRRFLGKNKHKSILYSKVLIWGFVYIGCFLSSRKAWRVYYSFWAFRAHICNCKTHEDFIFSIPTMMWPHETHKEFYLVHCLLNVKLTHHVLTEWGSEADCIERCPRTILYSEVSPLEPSP